MAKRGRPATFDRSEALERAMEVFWARGFEGATLEELQAAMGGISPPSFYNAFGSKEALFKEAADLYVARVGDPQLRALNEAPSAREGIAALLMLTAEQLSQPGKPHGCLLVLAATKCSPGNRGPEQYLHAIRLKAPAVIRDRLARALAEGEISPDLDIDAIAAFYATVVHGLGVRAGDGASRAHLAAAVRGAMAAWTELTTYRGGKPTAQRKRRNTGP